MLGWFVLLCALLFLRWQLLQKFLRLSNRGYFQYQKWHNRFYLGVIATGAMLGCGAALLMPFITTNVQIILHSALLAMCAGAIAYLSTSLRVYIAYMVTTMMPVTVWLFLQQNSDTYVLSFLYLFFMIAGWISVKRMNDLVNDALYYRYDNEILIDDLQRLLASVSSNNKALEKISTTDELTGISNYRAFRVHLEDVWRQYAGNKVQVSLIKLNLDYFQEYNAYYGQEAAEETLVRLARLLNEQIAHQSQLAARLHGAEFALLLPGVSCENARQVGVSLQRALTGLAIEHARSRVDAHLTMSIGIGSQSVAVDSSSRELLVRVDTALKLAVERGRNRIEVLEG